MGKLIFRIHKNYQPTCGNIVRISDEAVELVHQIQRETGFSARKIISDMIKYGAQNYEIVEE